jgi:hypothetical protein
MDITRGGTAPDPALISPTAASSGLIVEQDADAMAEGEAYDPGCLDNEDSDGSDDMETEGGGDEDDEGGDEVSTKRKLTGEGVISSQDGTVGVKTFRTFETHGSDNVTGAGIFGDMSSNPGGSGKGNVKGKKEPPPTPATEESVLTMQNERTQSIFKQQYYVIRAQRARQSAGIELGGVGPYGRDSEKDTFLGKEQGFEVKDDQRQFRAKNFHDARGGRNVSSSLELEGMLCLACEKQHSLSERMEREEPVALVLCDQNFPPILPTNDGRCISVIRIEDGRLFELEKTFAEILPGIIKPHGRLPAGSVVMVGSLSHLGSHGLESYTGDLVKIMTSMAAALGGGGWP